LFAAGEVACTGVHGANRLASNSLLEGLVFGARAGQAMMQPAGAIPPLREGWRLAPPIAMPAPHADGDTDVARARDVMWRSVGLFRSGAGLTHATDYFDHAYAKARSRMDAPDARGSAAAWRTFNLLTVSRLIAHAALRREESRGGHFREDFPARDDLHWKVHLVDVTAE
jgi:L-aspartate oxidase